VAVFEAVRVEVLVAVFVNVDVAEEVAVRVDVNDVVAVGEAVMVFVEV
jgi:hypothetical protein